MNIKRHFSFVKNIFTILITFYMMILLWPKWCYDVINSTVLMLHLMLFIIYLILKNALINMMCELDTIVKSTKMTRSIKKYVWHTLVGLLLIIYFRCRLRKKKFSKNSEFTYKNSEFKFWQIKFENFFWLRENQKKNSVSSKILINSHKFSRARIYENFLPKKIKKFFQLLVWILRLFAVPVSLVPPAGSINRLRS